MCKLSNLYVIDLYSENVNGGIIFNVANSLPQLMNQPCKIVVKQIQSAIIFPGTGGNIDDLLNFRVVHNINIQSGTNYPGFSNSNTLCFFDTYKIRATSAAAHTTASTDTECILYAPNGILIQVVLLILLKTVRFSHGRVVLKLQLTLTKNRNKYINI